jgi:protein involved in polysaccharide export with SLBB domain
MRLKSLWSLLLLTAAASACAPVVKNPTPLRMVPAPEPGWEYKLHVGDELDVKFFFNPDLNERLIVRPDGRISLQLVPEIVAAGMTPRELTDLLKQEYSKELSNPELTVIVRSFAAQVVFVGGEVEKPGELRLVGPLTILQAVSVAQGFKPTARMSEVIVIRRNPDRTPLVVAVNLQRAIDGSDLAQDLALTPYDIVFVPRSPIANLSKFVDQYLRQNIPINFSIAYRIDPQLVNP